LGWVTGFGVAFVVVGLTVVVVVGGTVVVVGGRLTTGSRIGAPDMVVVTGPSRFAIGREPLPEVAQIAKPPPSSTTAITIGRIRRMWIGASLLREPEK
jgi:hypothetical protein